MDSCFVQSSDQEVGPQQTQNQPAPSQASSPQNCENQWVLCKPPCALQEAPAHSLEPGFHAQGLRTQDKALEKLSDVLREKETTFKAKGTWTLGCQACTWTKSSTVGSFNWVHTAH